jgi:hypothetical protein
LAELGASQYGSTRALAFPRVSASIFEIGNN